MTSLGKKRILELFITIYESISYWVLQVAKNETIKNWKNIFENE